MAACSSRSLTVDPGVEANIIVIPPVIFASGVQHEIVVRTQETIYLNTQPDIKVSGRYTLHSDRQAHLADAGSQPPGAVAFVRRCLECSVVQITSSESLPYMSNSARGDSFREVIHMETTTHVLPVVQPREKIWVAETVLDADNSSRHPLPRSKSKLMTKVNLATIACALLSQVAPREESDSSKAIGTNVTQSHRAKGQ